MNKPGRNRPAARSRRDFIKASSLLVAGGAVSGGLSGARAAHAFGGEEIKLGLVGCGVRGVGAATQALNTAADGALQPGGPVRLVALGDVFGDSLQRGYRTLRSQHGDRADVPVQRRFQGLDAYRRVLDCDVDVVILATPPGWRPLHFEAAVQAGKHVFLESPVATDAVGVRRLLAANQQARQQGLSVAVGAKRRREVRYQETIRQLWKGAIGDIICARVYWNGNGTWVRPRQPGQTELEYQLRNWYYFNWLSGDHIVEQHVHNLDVINWLLREHPQQCNGMGGRQVRTGVEYGQIYDHHYCEYTYAGGVKMFSQCRHIPGCWNNVSEHVHGSHGSADISGAKIYDKRGQLVWKGPAGSGGGQQAEWNDLVTALRRGEVCNEVERAAESTFTAILGRMASYSGKVMHWDDAISSDLALADWDALTSLDCQPPVAPADGTEQRVAERYEIAVPGKTRVV
jgi:predicted dehydrogenase